MLVPQVVDTGCEKAGEGCIGNAGRGSLPVNEGGSAYLVSKVGGAAGLMFAVCGERRKAFKLPEETRLHMVRRAAAGLTRCGIGV